MFIDGRVALVHTSYLKDYFSLYLSSQRAKTITQKVYPSDYESRNLAAVETERGFHSVKELQLSGSSFYVNVSQFFCHVHACYKSGD